MFGIYSTSVFGYIIVKQYKNFIKKLQKKELKKDRETMSQIYFLIHNTVVFIWLLSFLIP